MFFDYFNLIIGVVKILLYKLVYYERIIIHGIPKINFSTDFYIKKGSNVEIGKAVRMRNNISVRSYDNSKIQIGNNCFINDNCQISSRAKIIIGNNVMIGNNVSIYDNDHDYKNDINKYCSDEINIGDNVWIGCNVIILKGVTIGENCIIGAGTVVTKSVPENTVIINKNNLYEKKYR